VIELSLHLHRREYPEELILEEAILARQLDRTKLLQIVDKKTNDNNDNVFLIITFHLSDHKIHEIVHKNWDILGQSALTEYFFHKKLEVGFKHLKHLQDTLVNAGIP